MANVHTGQDEYDAIVVGSGVTGGFAAKELTERGLRTLMLERGRDIEHGTDYITEDMRPWQSEFRGRGDRRKLHEDHYMQMQAGPVGEYNAHFFVNDRESPYTFDEDKPFLWIRAYGVGGRSLVWGRHCYRWSDMDFEANVREGIGVDWPLRYADIEPWYDRAEEFVGISGQEEGHPAAPDGRFLPPIPLNCVEESVREAVRSRWPRRILTPGRTANLTRPHNGRGQCRYRSACSRGCSYGAYFSTQSATLPVARATGNLTLRPDSIVHSVLYDEERDRAVGVRVIDRVTHEEIEFRGRLIFLCASTLGSTHILLNSASRRFPTGLANSSGALGHYLMDHHFKVGASAELPDFEDQYYAGRRPNGVYMPRFRNIDDDSRHPDFVRGYGYQGGASRSGWGRGVAEAGFGADFKHSLREPGPWRMNLVAFGEMLPRHENYVELDPEVTDAWGIPVLHIHATLGDNERAMREDMANSAAEMLEAAGGRDVRPYTNRYAPGEGIHEMGTARMGRDPQTSVLNEYNQAHDVPNLFVTDGACMASSACQNPSITYLALTARAVDHAVAEGRRGNL